MTPVQHEAERLRLNRRLKNMPDPEVGRQLKYYRARISKATAIDARGCGYIHVQRSDGGMAMEGADILSLCHAYLDEQGVPADYV